MDRAQLIMVKTVVAAHQLLNNPELYAQGLYAELHQLDAASADEIWVETPPQVWNVINDRLTRAAYKASI